MRFKYTDRYFFTLIFLVTSFSLVAQETQILEPKIGKEYDFSQERQDQWIICDSLMLSKSFKDKFTQKKFSTLMNKCSEIGYSEACDDMWSVVCGDDWTDEGYNIAEYINQHSDYRFTSASSALKEQCDNLYDSENISDLNYQTAWVEGVKGYGIGEFIEYKFPPSHPRITTVIIANGYIKSKEIWKDNARVKQLKMYLNNKPFAILNLKDVYAEQAFEVLTIGYKKTYHTYQEGTGRAVTIPDKKDNVQPSIIKFEILSVYKGDKYKDTAITEIYFDGLDVY